MIHSFYREVKTKQDMDKFDCEWAKVCEEKGVTFYPYHPNSKRFFIVDEKGNDVGTIEFTKRDPDVFSVCEGYFDFVNHSKVSKNYDEILEVGKVSIMKEHQRNGHVDKILFLVLDYAEKHGITQCIGYINKEFLLILLMRYGIQMELLGKEIVHEKHISIPFLCDIEKLARRLEEKDFFRPQ
ncbi:TPA: hypothetical protein QCU24_003026 [Bacillus cereus]|nr:hypothetical protein [Bacillus cereus]